MRNARVLMLLRGGEDRKKSEAAAADFLVSGVKVWYLTKLHAKLYANESEAILTSMNLYAESAQNSYEVAVRFTKQQDLEAFDKVIKQMVDLAQKAHEEQKIAAVERAASGARPGAGPTNPMSRVGPVWNPYENVPKAGKGPHQGHCLRCSKKITFNAERPLCAECYKMWARFGNPDYEEVCCHRCGAPSKASIAKPLCRKCWSATG